MESHTPSKFDKCLTNLKGHLNSESCSETQSVKYLNIFIYKGHKQVSLHMSSEQNASDANQGVIGDTASSTDK